MPTISEILAFGIAALSLILNFTKGQRDSKSDSEARGRWQGEVNTTLAQIKTTSETTARRVEELAPLPGKIDDVDKRLGKLEEKFDRHCQEERGDLK